MKTSHTIPAGLAVLLMVLAACNPAPAATPMPAAAPSLTFEGAYGHASAAMPTAGGLFMVIKNAGAASDRLLSGKSDACGSIEIHEMVKKADGTMGMNLVTDPVIIPANGQLELKEGGLHIMCIMMKPETFKPGAQIALTLAFEKSGEKTVTAEIREAVASAGMDMETSETDDSEMMGVAIEGAWGRLSPSMPTAGGLFMVIKNSGAEADRLLSGKSEACGSVEVHEMVKKADGTMGMNLVDKPVEIPAGGQVELKPGGLHVMCIMMKPELFKPGQKISLILMFEKGGEKTVVAEIRDK